MRLFITGATGLIGRRVVLDRLERGDEVIALSRDAAAAAKVFGSPIKPKLAILNGNPAEQGSWQTKLAGCDAVIHLAGAGIADRRWSSAYKELLVSSRVESTRHVVNAIEMTPPALRPATLISGSAVGYYGDAGGLELDETSPPGDDFLAKLCIEWEAAALPAQGLGTRVVLLRTAVVLDECGGALKKMARLFRWFLGGPVGSGNQFFPWIHWRDVIGLIDLALTNSSVRGPLNAVAPQPLRSGEFARSLGRALGRPSWLPAPRLGLRLVLGEVADSLLASQRVIPAKALQLGYVFRYANVDSALRALVTRGAMR